MTDNRPSNCRFRLQDDGKPYPKSGCHACGRTITSGLGKECQAAAMVRTPPRIDVYKDAAMRLDMYGDKWMPTFLHGFMPQGITAKQAREAAHLLNQLAEYLETC